MKLNKMISASLLGASLVALAGSAHAATSWSFGGSGASIVSAYSVANISSGATRNNISSTSTFASATLSQWGSNLGAGGEGTVPQHAVDNASRTEALLVNLGGSYALTEFTLGYAYNRTNTSGGGNVLINHGDTTSAYYANGADVSVFAYTGGGAPIIAGKTYNQLLTDGWQLIGNYGNAQVGTTAVSTSVSSSYWLVAAYNSVFGGTCSGCSNATGQSSYKGTDYFKLSGVAGSQPGGGGGGSAPEPSTMALLGISMLGAVALRRRQNPAAV